MGKKIGRNDKCWCGSNRKYKKCHFLRANEERLPPGAIEQAARSTWLEKTCLHPEAGGDRCGKIISAHTIQRSRVLSRITIAGRRCLPFFRPAPTRINCLFRGR